MPFEMVPKYRQLFAFEWVICVDFAARAQMIRLKFDDEYARLSVIHNLISTLEISVKECVIPL